MLFHGNNFPEDCHSLRTWLRPLSVILAGTVQYWQQDSPRLLEVLAVLSHQELLWDPTEHSRKNGLTLTLPCVRTVEEGAKQVLSQMGVNKLKLKITQEI